MSNQIIVNNDSIFDPSPELINSAISALDFFLEIDRNDNNYLKSHAVVFNHNAIHTSEYPAYVVVRTDEAEVVGAALSGAAYNEMRCDFESGSHDLGDWVEDKEKVENFFLESNLPYFYDQGNITPLSEWIQDNFLPDENDIARSRAVAQRILHRFQERITDSAKL